MSEPEAAHTDSGTRRGESLRVARIDPERCIGCARCIEACPFDAIIGAPQRMHTVIDALCIGCRLCVAPCPVDCIAMPAVEPARSLTREEALAARARREERRKRLARRQAQAPASTRQALIESAVRRARERAACGKPPACAP